MIEFLIFGLIALSVLCLWLLIEGRKNPKFLAWFIPILLVLITSTYITYTSILGYPKPAIPEQGVYLKHYIDEPDWIYLWVVGKENIPKNFQIPYSRETHKALEGVKGKSDEGKFMMLGKAAVSRDGTEGDDGEDSAGGYTIGGDVNFYEWDHEEFMPPKE
jgi:hypothetical protein